MVLKDGFPVPVIEEVLAKLQNARYFSVMDLENGFFHVNIELQSRKYTAFVTKKRLFEFKRVPFGFCNSPTGFIRYVNYVFQQLLQSGIMDLYMDDIIGQDITASVSESSRVWFANQVEKVKISAYLHFVFRTFYREWINSPRRWDN